MFKLLQTSMVRHQTHVVTWKTTCELQVETVGIKYHSSVRKVNKSYLIVIYN